MQAAKRLFPRLATLFAYNFLMNGPIWTIFGMRMDTKNQNKIPFTLKKNQNNVGATLVFCNMGVCER